MEGIFFDYGKLGGKGQSLEGRNRVHLFGTPYTMRGEGPELWSLGMVGVLEEHEVPDAVGVSAPEQGDHQQRQGADACGRQVPPLAEAHDHVGGEDRGGRGIVHGLGEGLHLELLKPLSNVCRCRERFVKCRHRAPGPFNFPG